MNIYGSAYEESKRQANARVADRSDGKSPASTTKKASITQEKTGNRTWERNPFPPRKFSRM